METRPNAANVCLIKNNFMKYSKTLSLDCPYCDTKTQFISDQSKLSFCNEDFLFHDLFTCTNCGGLVVTKWKSNSPNIRNGNTSNFKNYADNTSILSKYHPIVGDFSAQIELSQISNESVRKDYKEAVDCYNYGFYNASMVMARRAIHQEVDVRGAKGGNLYKKIESLGLSENLKKLLNKVKNFGNSGAHPDYFLYDKEGEKLIPKENEKDFAQLSLKFLDRYFQDQYEIDDLIANAPNSEIENNKDNQ
jgi:hypothetical protein